MPEHSCENQLKVAARASHIVVDPKGTRAPMRSFCAIGRLLTLGLCMLSAVPFSSAQPRITLSEAFRVGDDPDDVVFARQPSVFTDSTGRVFLADGQAVIALSSIGDVVGPVGKYGTRPGEFLSPQHVRIGGKDSVYVWDGKLDRVTVFAPDDLHFIRTVDIPEIRSSTPAGLVCVTGKAMAIRYNRPYRWGEDEGNSRFVSVYVISLGGRQLFERPLTVLPDVEFVNYRTASGDSYGVNRPFNRTPAMMAGPGGLVYYGMTNSVSICVRSLDFADRRAIEWQHTPVPVTRADRKAIRQTVEHSEHLQKALDSATFPRFKPAYDTFIVDDQARVWLRLNTAFKAAETTWVVLDSASQEVGQFKAPAGLRIRAVRGDRAYATFATEDGVPLLIAYDIVITDP